MSIESKQFIATGTDIEHLASEIIEGEHTAIRGRSTYLRALVGTTQHELGIKPRVRAGAPQRLDDEGIKRQLKAFEAVATRFGAAVLKIARTTVPEPDAALLRSRTGFARSAASTLRGYIKAGNDITVLAAARVVKSQIATPRSKRKLTVKALTGRVQRLSTELQAVARNLYASNRETAREALQPILAALLPMAQASAPSKDAKAAIEAGESFQTKTGVFVPIDLSAVRAARRAA
jgi:hypothetical protein